MHRFAALRARYPAIRSLEVKTRRSGAGFEAQADVRLPQHQIILNASARDAAGAVRRLAEATELELEQLAARDPAIAPREPAFVRA